MCPLCECLPLASFPSTPVPNSTLQHCYTTYIMLISWSRGRSGQLQKWAFSLSKWVQNTHRAPHSPPECWISSKCQWFSYSIKYLAFRWGIGEFELGGKLIGPVWGRGCTGTTHNWCMYAWWYDVCMYVYNCMYYTRGGRRRKVLKMFLFRCKSC
jgi:hypothetical protein